MSLVTDGLPGLALAAEPPERGAMRRPPQAPSENIFARGLWQHAVWVGVRMAALALGTQVWAIHIGDSHWRTMMFTVLTLAQLAHPLAIRSEHESLFAQRLLSNRPLLAAVVGTLILQLTTIYVPALNAVFKTVPLTAVELGATIGIASTVFFAVEIEKWLTRRGRLYAEHPASTRTA